jgi:hypothetical protein
LHQFFEAGLNGRCGRRGRWRDTSDKGSAGHGEHRGSCDRSPCWRFNYNTLLDW